MDELSETARGIKKSQQNGDKNNDDKNNPTENVVSHASGHVDLKNGIATITNLSFSVPGADALVQGTFNVLNEKIDLHGTMKMEAKFSQSTSGIKSLFAKVLDPFFNKKRGSVVPVVVNGTPSGLKDVYIFKEGFHENGNLSLCNATDFLGPGARTTEGRR